MNSSSLYKHLSDKEFFIKIVILIEHRLGIILRDGMFLFLALVLRDSNKSLRNLLQSAIFFPKSF